MGIFTFNLTSVQDEENQVKKVFMAGFGFGPSYAIVSAIEFGVGLGIAVMLCQPPDLL